MLCVMPARGSLSPSNTLSLCTQDLTLPTSDSPHNLSTWGIGNAFVSTTRQDPSVPMDHADFSQNRIHPDTLQLPLRTNLRMRNQRQHEINVDLDCIES